MTVYGDTRRYLSRPVSIPFFPPPTDDSRCFFTSPWILSDWEGFNGRLVRNHFYSFLGELGILVKRYSPGEEKKKREREEGERGSLSFNVKLRPDSRRISSGKFTPVYSSCIRIHAQLLFNPRGWYHVWLIKFLCRRRRLRSV